MAEVNQLNGKLTKINKCKKSIEKLELNLITYSEYSG